MEATWKPHPFFSSPRKARDKFWSPYPCNQWEQKRYLPLPLFFWVFSSISCAWLAQLRYSSLAIHLEPSSAMIWYNGWVIWALCFEMWSEISELVVETIFCSGNHGIKIPKVEKPHWIAKHFAYRNMFITQSLTRTDPSCIALQCSLAFTSSCRDNKFCMQRYQYTHQEVDLSMKGPHTYSLME